MTFHGAGEPDLTIELGTAAPAALRKLRVKMELFQMFLRKDHADSCRR
jgi:hypothetical protein